MSAPCYPVFDEEAGLRGRCSAAVAVDADRRSFGLLSHVDAERLQGGAEQRVAKRGCPRREGRQAQRAVGLALGRRNPHLGIDRPTGRRNGLYAHAAMVPHEPRPYKGRSPDRNREPGPLGSALCRMGDAALLSE